MLEIRKFQSEVQPHVETTDLHVLSFFDCPAEVIRGNKCLTSLKHLRLLVSTKLDGSFVPGNRRSRARLAFSALVFCLILFSRIAAAQSPTVTTLIAISAGPLSGSIVAMTANVSSAGQPVSGGTVTFRDTFAGAAQDLGTVQVQSANGTPGLAVLKTEVGGVGSHSIVAIYNAPKAYSTSTSAPAALTFQSPYSSATALAVTGSRWELIRLVVLFQLLVPFSRPARYLYRSDKHNTTIGTVPLDPTTATQGFTPPTLYQIPTSRRGLQFYGNPGEWRLQWGWSSGFCRANLSRSSQSSCWDMATVPFSRVPVFRLLSLLARSSADFNGDGILDLAIAIKELIGLDRNLSW